MGLLSYLGFTAEADYTRDGNYDDSNNPIQALPSNWYTSPELYGLERRAIFSRKWQLITHSTRLGSPGDFVKFEVAGNEFVLTQDRHGKINAFHNVCRHRAYPVVTKDCGSAKIFSCKYHGWSYGLNGKLTKAPGYQELPGFDKDKNSLFPIHMHLDKLGFVWINLDSQDIPEVAWEDDFGGVEAQLEQTGFDMDQFVFDHTWQIDGDYNWKLLADDHNGRYNNPPATSNINGLSNMQDYKLDMVSGSIAPESSTTNDAKTGTDLVRVSYCYHFPNTSTAISPHCLIIQRFVPTGPSNTTASYQVFRNKTSAPAEFETASATFKRVMTEDLELFDKKQKNLGAGVFVSGGLDSTIEQGSHFFQSAVRETVMAHHERERQARKEIWPAQQKVPDNVVGHQSHEDEAFCASLCSADKREELSW